MSKLDEYQMDKVTDEYRKEALRKVSTVVIHQQSAEDFAKTLAYAWFDSQESAIKLADQLDLSKEEFLALLDEKEILEEYYIEDLEMRFFN